MKSTAAIAEKRSRTSLVTTRNSKCIGCLSKASTLEFVCTLRGGNSRKDGKRQ